MKRETLKASYLRTVTWFNNTIVDWAIGGKQYLFDGQIKQLNKYNFSFNFDAAITSVDNKYQFIYKRLGTKGLLLKEGKILREINRSYYCANTYEYPASFVKVNAITYLIHCPAAYNQLDFENVETGELITKKPGRNPADIFHSRLEISPDNSFLMSKGWWWHPLDVVEVFNIKDCINNPLLLDKSTLYPVCGVEISTASFIDSNRVLIGSSDEVIDDENLKAFPPKHIAIWDLTTCTFSKPVEVKAEFGSLFAINERFAWDLFIYPKIIDIDTGEIIDKIEEFDSGRQRSSIIHSTYNAPQIIFNRETKQIAISGKDKIEVFTPDGLIAF